MFCVSGGCPQWSSAMQSDSSVALPTSHVRSFGHLKRFQNWEPNPSKHSLRGGVRVPNTGFALVNVIAHLSTNLPIA